ncbi:hypothetical protein Krac_9527 [Ktedonobacter racemifer DSM 44963]|uniref:Uncharacterized protein n=1 Tax=Ktedonobacter racemifer DSM 44963 TaxID=485913 RepID=D6TCL4_KTERA|nr:hypothetical protein Krac_9527 [Ktedonobacter racemifer DSM 44963]
MHSRQSSSKYDMLEPVTNERRPEPGRQKISMKTYDDIAEWYDQWIGTHSMSEDPFFLES